ncbi:MAG: hypothetical protein C0445_08625 [Polaromonas sp.]|nr:hypothetical protein [Polaromonas sp.]
MAHQARSDRVAWAGRQHPMRRHNWSMLQGEHRAVLLGGELVGRVSSGLLLLSHTVQGQREHQLLVGAGDWLGTEWLGQPPTQLSMTAFTAVRASWRVIRPTAYPSVVIGCLQATLSQHQRRATELLALRTGSADERCRHFLHLMVRSQPGAVGAVGAERAGPSMDLPPLKAIAHLLDLAPETACRALTRVRKAMGQAACEMSSPVGATERLQPGYLNGT